MDKQNQMQTGTWDRIATEDHERITFELNKAHKVVVINPIPKERTGEDGGVFYEFDVEEEAKKKVIQTSAWTLLKELKKANLKPGLVLEITKKSDKGKQFFVVTESK